MAKTTQKKDMGFLSIIDFLEAKGFKIRAVFTANSKMVYDHDKEEYPIKEINGRKFLRVNCDFLAVEIE